MTEQMLQPLVPLSHKTQRQTASGQTYSMLDERWTFHDSMAIHLRWDDAFSVLEPELLWSAKETAALQLLSLKPRSVELQVDAFRRFCLFLKSHHKSISEINAQHIDLGGVSKSCWREGVAGARAAA